MLRARSSEVRDVFDLSASNIADNLTTASVLLPIEFAVYELNSKSQRVSETRDVFDLSASDNSTTVSTFICFPALREKQMVQPIVTVQKKNLDLVIFQIFQRKSVGHYIKNLRLCWKMN
jgi:hypothetical protein